MSLRYVNKKEYPVTVMTKGGGFITFEPGEGTGDSYYKFCPDLTEEPSNDVGKRATPAATSSTSANAAPPLSFSEDGEQPREPSVSVQINTEQIAETRDYVMKSGILRCKHCWDFSTSKKESMLSHIRVAHQMEPELLEHSALMRNAVIRPKSVHSEPAAPVVNEAKQGKVEEAVNGATFVCPHCPKMFNSEDGLKAHLVSKHGGQLTEVEDVQREESSVADGN